MGKTLNFDLFMQEHEQATIDVTVYGDVYKVPMEVPAIVPVLMARAEMNDDANISMKLILRAADTMFGAENVDKMCKKGMSARNLASLIEKLFKLINGTSEEDEEEQDLSDDDGHVQTTSGKRSKK